MLHPNDRLQAEIRMLRPEEGRRPIAIQPGYRPHLRVGAAGTYLGVSLAAGPDRIEPGDSAVVTFELLYEGVDYSPLTVGARFDILEGPIVVGKGIVLSG